MAYFQHMRPNYKFHAMALTVICAIITVLFFLFGPKEPAPVVDPTMQGNRFVEIYSATWGRACNDFIRQEIAQRRLTPPEKDEDGKLIPQPKLELVTTNNVLPAVSKRCDGKLRCDISADSTSLEVEPQSSCMKKLEVSYRCFAYDRLWNLTIEQNETKTIDCDGDDSTPAPAPATGE